MKLPTWVPVLLQLLTCTGLASAVGDKATPLSLGLTLGNAAQPHRAPLSLELDFFLKVADHEFKVSIMPLHLLGKKSWNVYNTANIEKVKRDEAAAAALEAAEEERMQDVDAARRMAILRGEIPTPLAIEDGPRPSDAPHHQPGKRRDGERRGEGRERKKRKRAGENDTDFEMRVAREGREALAEVGKRLVLRKETEAPLVDQRGHIDLFPRPEPAPTKAAEKNAEAEKETARKRKEYEDQYTMRFSNAAGFKQGLENPWYSKTGGKGIEEEVVGRDVWGNEDPRRREREILIVEKRGLRNGMKDATERVRGIGREGIDIESLGDAPIEKGGTLISEAPIETGRKGVVNIDIGPDITISDW
ncbi:hypothetical protein LZ554_009353 [Drepanopeziza brunnea f. sp. 'monogermtubi']|nr:hypothetical protein LZ554_009353 [Drepanopeziza brunnea f. sp. 'monogermtubi']